MDIQPATPENGKSNLDIKKGNLDIKQHSHKSTCLSSCTTIAGITS